MNENNIQDHRSPHIGAFVLETLTLGMYGEPKHTIREYVQNAFDSIRSAKKKKLLNQPGSVKIQILNDKIIIRDNGLGVSEKTAWSTLTSIGASKKDRQKDAGFRGIGRLGGMAYCKRLVFKTTFSGEESVTEITFDCDKLMGALNPDEGSDLELALLLSKAISHEVQENAAASKDHYFEVRLEGLENAPESLTNLDKVIPYLSQTLPVSYSDEWEHKEEIEKEYTNFFDNPLDIISVSVAGPDADEQEILKPYGDVYQIKGGISKIDCITFYSDADNGWWGWIGTMTIPAAVTDRTVGGIRVRLRNIQVDGTNIIRRLFTEVKPSYSRFANHFVGTIYLDPKKVIPNARRDDFEETSEWESIQDSLIENLCSPLVSIAYERSKSKQSDISKIVEDAEKLSTKATNLAQNSKATYDQVVDLMTHAKRLRKKALIAAREVEEVDEVIEETDEPQISSNENDDVTSQKYNLENATHDIRSIEDKAKHLLGQIIQNDDDEIIPLKNRIREEVFNEVLDIISPLVEIGVYHKIKRELENEL